MGIGAYNQPTGIAGLLNFARKPVVQEPVQPSMIQAMVDRANTAYQNVDVPTLQELFPYLNVNYQLPTQAPSTNNSYGAGRFLGNTQSLPFNFNAPTK